MKFQSIPFFTIILLLLIHIAQILATYSKYRKREEKREIS